MVRDWLLNTDVCVCGGGGGILCACFWDDRTICVARAICFGSCRNSQIGKYRSLFQKHTQTQKKWLRTKDRHHQLLCASWPLEEIGFSNEKTATNWLSKVISPPATSWSADWETAFIQWCSTKINPSNCFLCGKISVSEYFILASWAENINEKSHRPLTFDGGRTSLNAFQLFHTHNNKKAISCH